MCFISTGRHKNEKYLYCSFLFFRNLKKNPLLVIPIYILLYVTAGSHICLFFHSCFCLYQLNQVHLLNQNTPQQTGNSSHKNHNVFSFPLSTWNRKLSSWPNIIRPHSHSQHYNSQMTSYYSSSITCYTGAFGSFWLKWQPASVSRATEG